MLLISGLFKQRPIEYLLFARLHIQLGAGDISSDKTDRIPALKRPTGVCDGGEIRQEKKMKTIMNSNSDNHQ